MSSRKWIGISAVLLACLATGVGASAQYGGSMSGGTGATGTGGGMSNSKGYSYGSGQAIGIGVGAAAAATVGIALLVRHHHHTVAAAQAQKSPQVSLTGCTQSILNGISIKNEKDNLSYMLVTGDKATLPVGERIQMSGVVTSAGSNFQEFRVKSVVKDYGTCGANPALAALKPVQTPAEPAALAVN
jgi:hypothetical protein